jgi:hypothetical protein
MRKRLSLFLLLFAIPTYADQIFTATLAGLNENPPNASPATGFIKVDLHNDGITLDVVETFSGLLAPATAAHIHCCAGLGTNAPVVLPFSGFPVGSTSGTYFHTFDLNTDLVGITPSAFIAALDAGTAYANIHDTTFPGGEIRGQLQLTVPEPSSLLLVGFGILGIAERIRRKANLRRICR